MSRSHYDSGNSPFSLARLGVDNRGSEAEARVPLILRVLAGRAGRLIRLRRLLVEGERLFSLAALGLEGWGLNSRWLVSCFCLSISWRARFFFPHSLCFQDQPWHALSISRSHIVIFVAFAKCTENERITSRGFLFFSFPVSFPYLVFCREIIDLWCLLITLITVRDLERS